MPTLSCLSFLVQQWFRCSLYMKYSNTVFHSPLHVCIIESVLRGKRKRRGRYNNYKRKSLFQNNWNKTSVYLAKSVLKYKK